MAEPSMLSKFLGLFGAEIFGAVIGGIIGYALGFGDTGVFVGALAGGIAHIILRSNRN